jgi:hypothetical protein
MSSPSIRLRIDRVLRHLLPLAAGALCVYYVVSSQLLFSPSPEKIANALGVCAQIAATMLGFMFTVLSILSTLTRTLLLKNMIVTGKYDHLLNRIGITCIAYFLMLVAAISGLAIDGSFLDKIVLIVAFLTGASTVLLAEVGRKFYSVIRFSSERRGGSIEN